MNSNRKNNDLNNYISSSRNKKKSQSYAAAVTSTLGDSMTRLSTLRTKFEEILSNKTNTIPVGHPDSAATSMFLANKHKDLGKEPDHGKINVGVANANTMNSITTQQLQLAPEFQWKRRWHTGLRKWIDC